MKITIKIAGVLLLVTAIFSVGYCIGRRNAFHQFPLGFYTQEVEASHRYVDKLNEGNVKSVLEELQTNLSLQIIQFDWIWKNAPDKFDRDRAFELLKTIAEHRSAGTRGRGDTGSHL